MRSCAAAQRFFFLLLLRRRGGSQLKPKDRYPLVQLKDKSLYELIPGKLYAINKDTMEVWGIYKNQREL
jgi:hypothetical protein